MSPLIVCPSASPNVSCALHHGLWVLIGETPVIIRIIEHEKQLNRITNVSMSHNVSFVHWFVSQCLTLSHIVSWCLTMSHNVSPQLMETSTCDNSPECKLQCSLEHWWENTEWDIWVIFLGNPDLFDSWHWWLPHHCTRPSCVLGMHLSCLSTIILCLLACTAIVWLHAHWWGTFAHKMSHQLTDCQAGSLMVTQMPNWHLPQLPGRAECLPGLFNWHLSLGVFYLLLINHFIVSTWPTFHLHHCLDLD